MGGVGTRQGRRRLLTGAVAGLGAAAVGGAAAPDAGAADRKAPGAGAADGTQPEAAHRGRFTRLVVTNDNTGDARYASATTTMDEAGATVVGATDGSGSINGTSPALEVSGYSPASTLVVSQAAAVDQGGGVAAPGGVGAQITSETRPALLARTTSRKATADAVVVENAGSGRAILAESAGTASTIVGVNSGDGPALYAASTTANTAASFDNAGPGPAATFAGGRAQINLRPGKRASHPATGVVGDFYLDSRHRLWFCKGGTAWHLLVP